MPARYWKIAGLLAMAVAGSCSGPAGETGVRGSSSALGVDGAHEHGVARLSIAVDDADATIELEVPAQTLYGFEGKAKSPAQQEQQEAALRYLQERFFTLFVFDATLGCLFDAPDVKAGADADAHHDPEPHDDAEEEHSEVLVRAVVRCAKSPAGSTVQLRMAERFPQIQRVDLRVLSEQAQSGMRIDPRDFDIRL